METPKQAANDIIRGLPDDATFDDIMYRLYVRAKIERALKEAEAGNLVDQDEAEKMMSKWTVQ